MAKTNLFDAFKQHLIGGIHMSDEVQQSNEGVTLALSAVAEVLSKMDERLAKQEAEEIKKAELAEAELQKSELAEMIKSIVSQAVAACTKADEEELKRFIRKWGYFGHDYKPKYNSTLVLDINTSPNITTLSQIEPYFDKIVLNDEVLLNQLISFIEFESTYYSNKRWNYTKKHWDKVKSTFMLDNIKEKIILEENYNFKDDIIIKTDLYSLYNLNDESNNFIQHSNQIFSNLLKANKDNYKGNYNIGCFNIEIKQLVDSNLKHLNFKPYNLLLNLEEFKFI